MNQSHRSQEKVVMNDNTYESQPTSNEVPHELKPTERREINNLVKELCTNYDSNYGCLLLNTKCVMLNKVYSTCTCKYFRDAVLPSNIELEVALHGDTSSVRGSIKICTVCGKKFAGKNNRALYCSDICRQKGTQNKERLKKRNQRSK